jgi:hypothetical protein
LVTEKKSVKLNDFKKRGVVFQPKENYFLFVKKIPNYTSVDEYLSTFPLYNEKYNSVINSDVISFKTAP